MIIGQHIAPRKRPRQARSCVTVDVILEATAQLMAAGGTAAVDTNKVALRAGVSVGSVYQYFPNRQSLIGEVKRRALDHFARGVREALDDHQAAPLEDAVREMVRSLITRHLDNPNLCRVLEYEVVLLPEADFPEAVNRLQGVRRFRSFLEARQDELPNLDLDYTSFVVCRAFRLQINEALRTAPYRLSSGMVEDELTAYAMRILCGDVDGVRAA